MARLRILWFIIKHQFFDSLQIIGLRDRLRCIECEGVGTWKPHGGWFCDSTTSGRRWTCKWCGLYIGIPTLGPERVLNQGIIREHLWIGVFAWNFWDNEVNEKTPFKPATRNQIRSIEGYEKINPWHG